MVEGPLKIWPFPIVNLFIGPEFSIKDHPKVEDVQLDDFYVPINYVDDFTIEINGDTQVYENPSDPRMEMGVIALELKYPIIAVMRVLEKQGSIIWESAERETNDILYLIRAVFSAYPYYHDLLSGQLYDENKEWNLYINAYITSHFAPDGIVYVDDKATDEILNIKKTPYAIQIEQISPR